MKVRKIMTPNPVCCTPETSLRDAARMFVDHDCGAVSQADLALKGREKATVEFVKDVSRPRRAGPASH
jgi:CBS domain-containing protein